MRGVKRRINLKRLRNSFRLLAKIQPMAKYKVTVDRNLCIGAGSCVAVAPQAFALDNEAKAIVLPTNTAEDDNMILEAAKACPVAAIIIQDETGKQVFP